MSWVALGAAAVGAVGSVVSSSQSKKNAGTTAAPLNVNQISTDSINANNQNEPEIEALLSSSNAFQQQQKTSLLNQAVPGYSQIAGNLSGIAQNASANPYALPKDFSDNLTRLAAERGINTGVKGQAGDYSLLRDFGVNELQYGQQNINNAQSITSMLAGLGSVNPLSPLSFYTTPQQALSAASGNQNLAQSGINAQNAANNNANANTWNAVSKLAGTGAALYNNQNTDTISSNDNAGLVAGTAGGGSIYGGGWTFPST